MEAAREIQVMIKEVYGNTMLYPVCDTAKTFASMLKTITLTNDAIRHIKELGFKVVVVPREIKL